MKSSRLSAKKIAVLALFTALGLIVFVIENQFPPLFVPGAKMGLANIFSLAALILYGPIEAFIVVVVRTFLGSLFAGNISMLMYSFTGGVISLAVSSVLMYIAYPRVSLMAVSIVAAVVHNIVQNTVYVLVTNTPTMFGYMPYLALIGILSGAIVGAVVELIFKRVPLSVFARAGFTELPKSGAHEIKGNGIAVQAAGSTGNSTELNAEMAAPEGDNAAKVNSEMATPEADNAAKDVKTVEDAAQVTENADGSFNSEESSTTLSEKESGTGHSDDGRQ